MELEHEHEFDSDGIPTDIEVLESQQPVIAQGVCWAAVHGALCLALRHPEFSGEVRKMVSEFTRQLGKGLVKWGVFSADTMKCIEYLESSVTSNQNHWVS